MKPCSKNTVTEVRLRLDPERCRPAAGSTLTNPTQALEIMRDMTKNDAQESLIAIYLSAANAILSVQRVSLGGLNQTPVDPKVLFAGALLAGASAFIFGHNHPSGQVVPSNADDVMTRQVIEGARLLTLQCLDHIVFSADDSYSYVQHGRLKFS